MAHPHGWRDPGPSRKVGGRSYSRDMGERCVTCFGPVSDGLRRCYQCGRHWAAAPEHLADVVVPMAYAVRGTLLARDLWRYKNGPAAAASRDRLRMMALGFLRDHGACVWRAAGMGPGPDAWAVVPTGRGRLAVHPPSSHPPAGHPPPAHPSATHPLASLVAPYLRRPLVTFTPRADRADRGRDLDPEWLRVRTSVRGRAVLLLDDTWVTGSSAQSAAVALKLAGASQVAIVVLGRYLDPGSHRALPPPGELPKPTRETCVVHAGHTGNSAALPTCSSEWVADRLL